MYKPRKPGIHDCERKNWFAITNSLSRVNTFFYMSLCTLVTGVIVPSLSAKLMQISPWYPVTAGLALVALTIIFSMFIPETLPQKTGTP